MQNRCRSLLYVLALWVTVAPLYGAAPPSENVVLILVDGFRWQELFTGADETLMNKENGAVQDVDGLRRQYWRDTPQARRDALLPFVWTVIAKHGQLFGDQQQGSVVRVTNGFNFSYPGYSEMLVGFGDPRVDSNDKRPNPNLTVFEWLHGKPALAGHVAAFGAWEVVPFIFNRERCGFYVSGGLEPLLEKPVTPAIELLNLLKTEIPARWGAGEAYDALLFYSALEYFKQHKPRVFYIAFGETDEWGHEGKYAEYLNAAHRIDSYVRMLWETMQVMPEYRDQTTLIVTADHGRGDGPQEWKDHGKKTAGSENVWIAIIGPATPALGVRANTEAITLSQVAATVAAAVGEDYCAAAPQAAKPIAGAVEPARR